MGRGDTERRIEPSPVDAPYVRVINGDSAPSSSRSSENPDIKPAALGGSNSGASWNAAVVKIAGRCNLNCSYCYMYNLADTSYLTQPGIMCEEVADALIARAVEHCSRHSLPTFQFVFHGGEPLLAGLTFVKGFIVKTLAEFPSSTKPLFSIQTNGTLLTSEWCKLFKTFDVRLGISLDGPKGRNDVNRVDHHGKGSYDAVRKGWDLALSCGLEPGLLHVIDITSDVAEMYQHVKALTPRVVDFLLPDATYDSPPLPLYDELEITPYGDWLLRLFHIWTCDGSSNLRIKLFEGIIGTLLGADSNSDSLGPGKNRTLIIETDGSIEPVDVLKVCKNGITKTALNVRDNALDSAFDDQTITLYYDSADALCSTCRKCMCRRECCGGYLPHRYRSANDFDNPSIYCRDLMKLITGIREWVVGIALNESRSENRIKSRTYSEARQALLSQ